MLADINGQPMIKRVLIQCSKAKLINELILCTDSKSLAIKANEWGFNSIITEKSLIQVVQESHLY